jgi:hypothetical protein
VSVELGLDCVEDFWNVLELVDAHWALATSERHRIGYRGRSLVEVVKVDDGRVGPFGDGAEQRRLADGAGALQRDSWFRSRSRMIADRRRSTMDVRGVVTLEVSHEFRDSRHLCSEIRAPRVP